MATSGTYSFAPSTGELILMAYARIGIRPNEVTTGHIVDGQREANLWLASIANRGPNLWTVELQSTPLVAGTASYAVPATTVMILDAYVSSGTTDLGITPVSRTDYAAIAEKTQAGRPTSFWFDRKIAPTVTLWPVPDQAYTLRYYRYRQGQDANLQSGENIEVPYLFLDCFVAALAHRLARIWAPTLEALRKADADEAWAIASSQNTENVPLHIAPMLDGYFQ